jgi:hypothetical protein
MPVEDSNIAAIARRHNLIIATGNVKDFQRPGIKIFNPSTRIELDAVDVCSRSGSARSHGRRGRGD